MSTKIVDRYQKGLIITDDIAVEPILDFDLYRDAIVNIIRNSYPKFTIGIFGDWGTGKTTLMNTIDESLKKNNNHVVRVRFETWRYEREDQFVLIPLLKTIAFALPEENQFMNLKQKLKRGAVNFLKKTPDIISSIISKYVNEDLGEISKGAFDSFKNEFNSKMELLADVDRDTLYFDGFEDIKNEITRIRKDKHDFRIVVFIDDLDRCSPKKSLEVLESIKVFLGMEGFIYIVGLSYDIVTKLIDIEYEKNGVKGEEYIKKIIQIPITLPKWINTDIVSLIQDLKKKGILNQKYKDIFNEKNVQLISEAIENNPREIKRFLNNFIVGFEIFSKKGNFDPDELLILQVIQSRWNKFYNKLINSEDEYRKKILNEIEKYLKIDEDKRIHILESNEFHENEDFDFKIRAFLRDFNNPELWKVLEKNFETLNKIKDWHTYRRATEVGIEPTEYILKKGEPIDINYDAYKLILTGEIIEFNRKRSREFSVLNLRNVDLTKKNLSGIDLEEANLKNAILVQINLQDANLKNAILANTDFSSGDLTDADLTRADLNGANLTGANMDGIYIEGTDFSNSIIINCNIRDYNSLLINENTRFNNAIIDNPDFVDYINKFTRNVPEKISNKNQLKSKLEEKKLPEIEIGKLLAISKLPE